MNKTAVLLPEVYDDLTFTGRDALLWALGGESGMTSQEIENYIQGFFKEDKVSQVETFISKRFQEAPAFGLADPHCEESGFIDDPLNSDSWRQLVARLTQELDGSTPEFRIYSGVEETWPHGGVKIQQLFDSQLDPAGRSFRCWFLYKGVLFTAATRNAAEDLIDTLTGVPDEAFIEEYQGVKIYQEEKASFYKGIPIICQRLKDGLEYFFEYGNVVFRYRTQQMARDVIDQLNVIDPNTNDTWSYRDVFVIKNEGRYEFSFNEKEYFFCEKESVYQAIDDLLKECGC